MAGECSCSDKVIKKEQVVLQLGNLNVNNGLTYSNSLLQLGGPLIKDTILTGNYKFELGSTSSRLSQVNIYVGNQLLLNYNNQINLSFTSSGALFTNTLSNTPGLVGDADYSTNYTNLAFIQKIYADSKIASKAITTIVSNPGSGQNGFFLFWNNGAGKYDLTAAAITIPGSNTQVLFNSSGNLGTDNKFTYSSGTLTIGDNFILGTAGVVGAIKTLSVQSSDTNIDLVLATKGTGSVKLNLSSTGALILGASSNTQISRKISVDGTQTNIDINIAPKGTNGILYIGDAIAAGGFRYIKPIGSNTDVSLVLQGQGNGYIVANTTLFGYGDTGVANTRVTLQTFSSTNCDLVLSPSGSSGKIRIGDAGANYSDFYLQTIGTSTNRNLRIDSNGTGRVIIDGLATKIIAIGAWNMGTTSSINIAHGLTIANIRTVIAMVHDDSYTTIVQGVTGDTSLNFHLLTGITNVALSCNTTVFGFSGNYAGSGNRGYIIIQYLA